MTTIRSDGTAHVFFVTSGNNEVAGVTLTNGGGQNQAGGGGGAVMVPSPSDLATLTLRAVTVTGNTASDGGGVADLQSDLTIIGSTIAGNLARSGGAPTGGGIVTASGTTTIIDSTISGNLALDEDGSEGIGGAIGGDDAAFVMRNVTIAANRSDWSLGCTSAGRRPRRCRTSSSVMLLWRSRVPGTSPG